MKLVTLLIIRITMIKKDSKIVLTNVIECTLVMSFATAFGSMIIWVLLNGTISILLMLCFITFMSFFYWKICSYNVIGEKSILQKRIFYKIAINYCEIKLVRFRLGGLSGTGCVINIFTDKDIELPEKVYIECILSQKEVQKVRDFLHEKGVETEFFIFDKKIA